MRYGHGPRRTGSPTSLPGEAFERIGGHATRIAPPPQREPLSGHAAHAHSTGCGDTCNRAIMPIPRGSAAAPS